MQPLLNRIERAAELMSTNGCKYAAGLTTENKRICFLFSYRMWRHRRTQLMNRSIYVIKQRRLSELRETEGAGKAKVRHAELETKQHEDHLRHFQVTEDQH